MTVERRPFDTDDIIRMYTGGQTLRAISQTLGVPRSRIDPVIRSFGLMRPRRAPVTYDRNEVLARYASGEKIAAIAEGMRISADQIRYAVSNAGVPLRSPRVPFDAVEVGRRYAAGESPQVIAAEYGISRPTVRSSAVKAGALPRSKSEAGLARFRREPDREWAKANLARVRNHAASVTETALASRARSRERNGTQIGEGETVLAGWIADRGHPVVRQRSVRRYNLDLSTDSTDIEVHRTKRSPLGGPAFQRVKDLADWGWHVIYVWVTDSHPLQPGAADDIVAFLDGPGRNPSTPGEYRVIRGCGELVASGCGDLDHWAGVRAPNSSHRSSRWHRDQCISG